MPARAEIQQEIKSTRNSAQDTIRRRYLHELAQYTGRDTILYMSGFTSIKASMLPPTLQSITVMEDINKIMKDTNV